MTTTGECALRLWLCLVVVGCGHRSADSPVGAAPTEWYLRNRLVADLGHVRVLVRGTPPMLHGLSRDHGQLLWRAPLPETATEARDLRLVAWNQQAFVVSRPAADGNETAWAIRCTADGDVERVTPAKTTGVCLLRDRIVFLASGVLYSREHGAVIATQVASPGEGRIECGTRPGVTVVTWNAPAQDGRRPDDAPASRRPPRIIESPTVALEGGCAVFAIVPGGRLVWARAFDWGEVVAGWDDRRQTETTADVEMTVREPPQFVGEEVGFRSAVEHRFVFDVLTGDVRSVE